MVVEEIWGVKTTKKGTFRSYRKKQGEFSSVFG